MKRILLLHFSLILIVCCNNESAKKYEEYDEEDFFEVQGIVTKVTRTPVIRFTHYKTNVYYIYYLDSDSPKQGKELDVNYFGGEGGEAVILVHKDNDDISFFGRGGVLPQGDKVLEIYYSKEPKYLK